ncbi:MAG TPA: FAD-dependent oxidoreductase, partial [Bacteroidales bacterium]|nr:FAD-dependent oxidoreductase [Bacteroidales bacterium]
IGGMMSHLDKTFPTGDCAICVISPKLVECARNLNIEILTLSELVKLEGEPGNFKAFIKKSPRFINEQICNDCGECTTACPVEIDDKFNRNLGKRKAIQKYYAQAIPNLPNLLKLGHAPCKIKCPANVNIQGYIQLIKKKEFVKAVNLIRERNPFSAICGRVCPAPCESVCTRSKVDSAVAIRQLKRFASDEEMRLIKSGELVLPKEKTPQPGAKRVAIIGAGPSGLTAASDLADMGYNVTIYEARSYAGGMLYWGIPRYRLPKEMLDYEIELIRRRGVTIVLNCIVGKDISFKEIRKENDVVYISAGAHASRKLGIQGEDKKGVLYGVEFLRQVGTQENKPVLKGNVTVIGGGNVAIDVARTALRLGAVKVELISIEQRNDMPAYKEEIEATLEEGITIRTGWGPNKIYGNGSVKGIELKQCVSVFDENGNFRPSYNEHKLLKLKTDHLIVAIGQVVDSDFASHAGVNTEKGCFKINPETLETSEKGIFAGGDNASGPASVIEAVAAGKRAAESIGFYLNGKHMSSDRFESSLKPVADELLPDLTGIERKKRALAEKLEISKRTDNFNEIESAFSLDAAITEAGRCLSCAQCSECMECLAACEKKAIDHSMTDQIMELEVGAVVLTPGIEEFTAEIKGEYGYKRYKNVLTSVQFERMLSAAGPYRGHVVRKDDGRDAKRIAWIQCVGSRDTKTNAYCSSICCMATTKQAMIASEHVQGMEGTIFNMDIRAHGKDFDQYFERARSMKNIRYIKSMPSRIIQVPQSNDLRLGFIDGDNDYIEKDFDLVVLAAGLDPKANITGAIRKLGIMMNEYGFCATDRLNPLITSKPGVFVGGAFQEPKDIPETVMQASAAASMAMELLSPAKNTLIKSKEYPQEHDVTDENPRIGVFVCHCGINIAGTVDVEKVTESISKEPGVVFASHTMYTCSNASLSNIKEQIALHRLNRIVVASCTPRTHEPIFRETLREAGLNPYLFELANIRDQCSWVHSSEPEQATMKAIELVKMSVSRSYYLLPLEGDRIPIRQNAVVFGGGVSGMSAALSLAEQGFDVDIIEKSDQLGGNLTCINSTLEHNDISGFRKQLIENVNSQRNIDIYLDSEINSVTGHIGDFKIKFTKEGKPREVSCGAIIIATGAKPAITEEYAYGVVKNIMTQLELEKLLSRKKPERKGLTYVMIQCVGSRTPEKPYCSRICCSMAVKNALKIKKDDPDARIFILYRDIRTYGFREKFYQEARKAGVVFIRYSEENIPSVSDIDGVLSAVKVESPDFPETLVIETDKLILSTGLHANEDNKHISDMLKVPLNANGFYVEAHMKLRPVDFATEGLFLCGMAHSPKMIDENISQAKAAAARAATILSKTHLEVGAQISMVDQKKCISCMTCIKACPYGAPTLNYDRKAEIEKAKCMGCGICASECPARAIQLNHFRSEHFMNMIDKLFDAVETV